MISIIKSVNKCTPWFQTNKSNKFMKTYVKCFTWPQHIMSNSSKLPFSKPQAASYFHMKKNIVLFSITKLLLSMNLERCIIFKTVLRPCIFTLKAYCIRFVNQILDTLNIDENIDIKSVIIFDNTNNTERIQVFSSNMVYIKWSVKQDLGAQILMIHFIIKCSHKPFMDDGLQFKLLH